MQHARHALALCVLSASAAAADAGVVGYSGNPTGNLADWTSGVAGLGATSTLLDFDTHPDGSLIDTFYQASHGVTLAHNFASSVQSGPVATSGTTTGTHSDGEGLHDQSRWLSLDSRAGSQMTINFAAGQYGAGIMVLDLFNPPEFANRNQLTLQAFTGTDGTGTLLGTFLAPTFNFQLNYKLFLGVTSTAGDIRSIRINNFGSGSNDTVGLDDVRITHPVSVTSVPLPRQVWGGIALLGGLAVVRWRRRRLASTAC